MKQRRGVWLRVEHAVAVPLASGRHRSQNGRESAMEKSQIEELAYQLWEWRGKPLGSSEADWLFAEELLRNQIRWSQLPMREMPLFSISMMKRTR